MAAGNRQSRIKALRYTKQPRFGRAQSVMPLRGIRWLSAWCVAVVLTACQPQPDALFTDYQDRLNRVLQLPTMPLAKDPLPALPGTQQLSIEIQPASIALLDLLALDVCDLETLVAERNSSLGKVMTDANQLQYELQLLVRLAHCLQTPAMFSQLKPALQQQLREIFLQKQRQLPQLLANMLSRDATLRQQLGGSQRGIRAAQGGISETRQALAQLALLRQRIEAGDYAGANQIPINDALGALYQSQLLADLQHSLRMSHSFFRQLNAQLSTVPEATLCKVDRDIRENLLQQIFIQRLQSELAQIDGITIQLLPPLLAVYHGHPLQSEIRQRLERPQLGLQQQLRQHVAFWQRWRQCP